MKRSIIGLFGAMLCVTSVAFAQPLTFEPLMGGVTVTEVMEKVNSVNGCSPCYLSSLLRRQPSIIADFALAGLDWDQVVADAKAKKAAVRRSARDLAEAQVLDVAQGDTKTVEQGNSGCPYDRLDCGFSFFRGDCQGGIESCDEDYEAEMAWIQVQCGENEWDLETYCWFIEDAVAQRVECYNNSAQCGAYYTVPPLLALTAPPVFTLTVPSLFTLTVSLSSK